MKRESHRSAGIVLIREQPERQYLLLRSALTRRPVWEFPKGAIEPGESELDAAQRELGEETAMRADDYRVREGFREIERYFFTRSMGEERRLISKQVVYFLAEWHRGEIAISREASRYLWANFAEAQRLLRFPEKRRVLIRAEQWLDASRVSPAALEVPPPLEGG